MGRLSRRGQHRRRDRQGGGADKSAVRLLLVCGALLLTGFAALGTAAALMGPERAVLAYLSPGGERLYQLTPSPSPSPIPESTRPPLRMTAETDGAKAVETVGILQAEAPQILIYHTHATEAYLMTGTEDAYEESGKWRTKDTDKSVVAVGEALKRTLTEAGFSVLHDVTNHEPPKLSTAYSRSLETMLNYQKRYPSLTIFIDVHRDAHGTKVETPEDYLTLDGRETARLMFVVGTGEGATGTGFAEMPDYERNLALAEAVTDRLNGVRESLARPVRVKSGRYNQHVSSQCMLVEVGHNANSFAQALTAAEYLGKAIGAVLREQTPVRTVETMAVWIPD